MGWWQGGGSWKTPFGPTVAPRRLTACFFFALYPKAVSVRTLSCTGELFLDVISWLWRPASPAFLCLSEVVPCRTRVQCIGFRLTTWEDCIYTYPKLCFW